MWRDSLARRERYLVVLVAICAVLLFTISGSRAADSSSEVLELHPGDNFVGWVAEPIAIADVFAQIPAAHLIYTWDADDRRYRYAIRDIGGNLSRVDPGMAVNIRVDGDQSVQWSRPLTPAKGGVTLNAGVNWIAWNGRDE